MSCIENLSEDEINKLRERIPFRIETQMAILQDYDHPEYNRIMKEEGGTCDNSYGDPKKTIHMVCQRKRGHRGKHYCYECGESW